MVAMIEAGKKVRRWASVFAITPTLKLLVDLIAGRLGFVHTPDWLPVFWVNWCFAGALDAVLGFAFQRKREWREWLERKLTREILFFELLVCTVCVPAFDGDYRPFYCVFYFVVLGLPAVLTHDDAQTWLTAYTKLLWDGFFSLVFGALFVVGLDKTYSWSTLGKAGLRHG
jgi:hypothetical protein